MTVCNPVGQFHPATALVDWLGFKRGPRNLVVQCLDVQRDIRTIATGVEKRTHQKGVGRVVVVDPELGRRPEYPGYIGNIVNRKVAVDNGAVRPTACGRGV